MEFAKMCVEVVDVMGSDLSVVNAARVSLNKVHEVLTDNDERLIAYLARNGHWSPFAHAQLSLRIKAPIFVARQLVKHQVGLSWNEVSRRYVDSAPQYFMPEFRERAPNVKQGSLDRTVSEGGDLSLHYESAVCHCDTLYKYMLENNVAPEVARAVLPVSMMTEWVWTGSLYAFARVVNLRTDPHAQREAQTIGRAIALVLRDKFPISAKYLLNG